MRVWITIGFCEQNQSGRNSVKCPSHETIPAGQIVRDGRRDTFRGPRGRPMGIS